MPPQPPRAVRSGKLVVGRVWSSADRAGFVKGSTRRLAKELAIELVARGLAPQGEIRGPRVTVWRGRTRKELATEDRAPASDRRAKDTDSARRRIRGPAALAIARQGGGG